jgi:hypothetical protein
VENRICLSRDVQVVGAAWRPAMRIVAGVGDLMQRTRDDRTGRILGDRTTERSGDAVCGLHRAREGDEHGFLGSASKPRSTVCQWFDLKTTWTVFSCLILKPVATVSLSLASKSVVGFAVEPQNHGGGGFPGLGLKTGRYSLVIWTSKSLRCFLVLALKTKQAMVYQLHHKIDGRVMAWDTCRDLAVCFAWKVGLGFPSLTSRLVEAR